MMKKLIHDGDFSHDPMDYIVHNYQMSDMLSISTILSDESDECFYFQMQRLEYSRRMIEWIEKFFPIIFETLASTFLSDLNEILIDLYSTNFTRLLKHTKIENQQKQLNE